MGAGVHVASGIGSGDGVTVATGVINGQGVTAGSGVFECVVFGANVLGSTRRSHYLDCLYAQFRVQAKVWALACSLARVRALA